MISSQWIQITTNRSTTLIVPFKWCSAIRSDSTNSSGRNGCSKQSFRLGCYARANDFHPDAYVMHLNGVILSFSLQNWMCMKKKKLSVFLLFENTKFRFKMRQRPAMKWRISYLMLFRFSWNVSHWTNPFCLEYLHGKMTEKRIYNGCTTDIYVHIFIRRLMNVKRKWIYNNKIGNVKRQQMEMGLLLPRILV